MINKHWRLFLAIFWKEWAWLKAYSFNTISSIVSYYIIFLIIFLGSRAMMGKAITGNAIEGLIVGYFIWICSVTSYSTLAWRIILEAREGTLEQLFMTPLGYSSVAISTIIASFIINICIIIPILFLLMATTGRYLHIDIITLFPLFIFTISGGFGLGFIVGGLGLLYKNIQAFINFIQFIFVALITAPVYRIPLLKLLPFALGTNLINKNMIYNIHINQMAIIDLLILLLNTVFYLVFGYKVLQFCEKIARDRGLLGHY